MTTISAATIEIPAALYPRSKRPTSKDVQHLIGVEFPPLTVAILEDDGATVLVDGAHRLVASIEEHGEDCEVRVEHLGTLSADAVLTTAIMLNAKHGKQLSMRDKEKCAKRLATSGLDNATIISSLAVAERSVTRWVAEARNEVKVKQFAQATKLIKAGASVTAAAKEIGVGRSTLQGWQKSPPEKATRPEPAPKGLTEIEGPAPAYSNPATERYLDRVTSIAAVLTEAAKDIAREDDDLAWPEFVEAVVATVRNSYPRGWKDYRG